MKSKLIKLIILLVAIIAAIKLVPFVNDVAREYLPEEVLALIGEKPKGFFEKSTDVLQEGLNKGADVIEDIADKIRD